MYVSKKIKISKIGVVQIIFPAGFDSQGVLNNDPTVWLYGAKPTQKYIIAKSVNIFGQWTIFDGNTPRLCL